MRKVRVKICGVTREEDLEVTVAAGADAIGFIVGIPSSPRNLSMQRAASLLKKIPVFIDSVIVTIPNNIESLIKIYSRLRPTAIQIHGKKAHNTFIIHKKIPNLRLIRNVAVKKKLLDRRFWCKCKAFDAILLDSSKPGYFGGTGIVHDWNISKKIKQIISPTPLILAGGLNPGNVKDAIIKVKPYAVDVSTGVELRPAIKDQEKVYAFIKNAKEVDL